MPNFIAVNWYGQGDLIDVVNTLNGVEATPVQTATITPGGLPW